MFDRRCLPSQKSAVKGRLRQRLLEKFYLKHEEMTGFSRGVPLFCCERVTPVVI